MSRIVALFEISDYNAWKARFDSDPVGRDEIALGYVISRNTANPQQILLEIEFASPGEAGALLDRLAHQPPPAEPNEMEVMVPPTIFEILDRSES
jgi:hypothetical protein